MKTRMFTIAAAVLFLAAQAAVMAQDLTLTRFPRIQQEAYFYRDTTQDINGRFAGVAPMFLIYPDTPCDEQGAGSLILELGIDKYLKEYSGSVCIMNPIDGKQYDNQKDMEAFAEFQNNLFAISNLKVIGIGSGATFVNSAVAAQAGAVAGIASIGGKPAKAVPGADPVPAFVAGKNASKVAKAYISQNGVESIGQEDGIAVYANAAEPLLRVAVSTEDGASLSETFDRAWKSVLCKNYRYNNFGHTWYTGAQFGQYGPYELEPYIMPDDLGITRRAVVKDLLGIGDFLWYEYFPEATLSAEKGTVPMVVLLHGNNNDPRTQAETSGFVELAAKENFIVVEMEWQGNGYAPMGLDGIEQVVYELLSTYPQIDPSRVYAEGLSAGAATATGLGIRKSHVFAAVGSQSAGVFQIRYAFGYNDEALTNEALQKRGAVETAYFSIGGTIDEVVPYIKPDNWEHNAYFRAWQVYQTMNGMDVTPAADFNVDPVFGIALAERETIQTVKNITVETGLLYKGDVPLIRLVAVDNYGHWNFKPGAQMMWDFFRHYSRDPQTKKLIYRP